MRRWRESRYRMLVVAVLVCALFVAASLWFLLYVRGRDNQESLSYLYDSVSQRKDAVAMQVEADFQLLRGVAVTLPRIGLDDKEDLNELLRTINDSNQFVRMGFAGPAGYVDLVDIDGSTYRDVYVGNKTFFRRAMHGTEAVSGTIHSVVNGEYVNYFAVPVWQDGQVAGVLCAVNTETIMMDILGVPVFRGEGFFAILNRNGSIIGPITDSTPDTRVGGNIFTFCTFPEGELVSLALALQNETGGHFKLAIDGVDQMVTAVPLGINGWSIVGVVPRQNVDGYYKITSVGISAFIGISLLIFLMLMLWQLRTMTSNQRQLEYMAYTDPLTGGYNYNKFQIEAKRLLDENPGTHYAIWSFDIKNFNAINELMGAKIGDAVLRRVAGVMANTQGEGALMCRMSADHFNGIRPYRDRAEMSDWFWKMIQLLARREVVMHKEMKIDDAMGIYCIDEFDTARLTVHDMVNRANVAKRAAKEQSGNAVVFFSLEMIEAQRMETELAANCQEALENREITFFLQPKVDIQDRYRIAGAEALARWHHPKYGAISPAIFIPILEKNNLIVHMDRVIFNQVCRWYVKNFASSCEGARVAVNVSRHGLLRQDFVEYYTSVKNSYNIADGILELEFTESVTLDGHELFAKIVRRLRANGFICSIDDFGAGYSSLNVLKNLPIDVLKLDAAFFRNSEDPEREQVVVNGFLHISRQLDVRTVAEGVETKHQLEYLRQNGCNLVQGYIFSKPLPKEEFKRRLLETNGFLAEPEK